MEIKPPSPDEIWSGDLFDRRAEAEHLIGYIESVLERPSMREDKRAYTIAVDARYGEGKSYFLSRLAKHISINHPVAFVDAWSDDLADEPLTALAATLKQALAPFTDEPEVQDRLRSFMAKSGRVAKIAAWGLFKRGAGLALTAGAVEAAGEVITGISEDAKGAIDDSLKDVVSQQLDDVEKAVRGVTSHKLMEERVATFEAGKTAIHDMKHSLEGIVRSLNRSGCQPPIVIVIDELDRCRPTYAVKLLEEIKHLFDVPGLVFILAMHSKQLSHSVTGAYGAGFDGRSYLRRFIDREYQLATPKLENLLRGLCATAGITDQSLSWPPVAISQTRDHSPAVSELIAEYMRVYGLGPRDAFQLVDTLQTALSISNRRPLYLPYLLPLAIGAVKGMEAGQLPEPVTTTRWVYIPNWSPMTSDTTEVSFVALVQRVLEATKMSRMEIETTFQSTERRDPLLSLVASEMAWNSDEQPASTISGYPRLLRAVGRFKNPKL